MDELVIQEHLAHYKQATETAREELAALQSKYQSVHSKLQDTRTRLASQDATVQELREANEGYKEAVARQTSLVDSLRERIHNTEKEMSSIASSRSLVDMKIQVLTKENQEMRERELQLENETKHYLNEWNKTKQEAADLERRFQGFTSRLAERMAIDLAGNNDSMESIISLVDLCWQERDRQKMKISALEERIKSHEVECKASRETVMRLVTEMDNEQRVSAARASDLASVRQELDSILTKKRSLETENQMLRERLQASDLALSAARQEAGFLERCSQDLDNRLRTSQNEARTKQCHLQAFLRQVTAVLVDQPTDIPLTEENVLERLKDLWSQKDDTRAMEAKLSEVSEELAKQREQQQEAVQRAEQAEQREQELQERLERLEKELVSSSAHRNDLNKDQQQYLKLLEQLSETMRIDGIATDIGFDMRPEAILKRAEQLIKQEGTALVESKILVHSLQRKVKVQKERLESKELHTELLRRKVTQLEEEKRSRSSLALERDDATVASKKLQKKVERLQAELATIRFSNTELKAQLAHTNELKIKVMEQNQTIEEQSKNLDKIKKNRAKVEKRLQSELQNQEQRARDELQHIQTLLQSQSSAMAELVQRERKLLDFCSAVSEILGVNDTICIPNHEIISRLKALIHANYHHTPLPCHCRVHHHHMAAVSEAPVSPALLPSHPRPKTP
ncbi:coiled-coil domain-containing protein 170 [Chanos chanos]|uniref:Coiled-coil domain-containing protein 170 n=1 Tax=Chanos chanos TaxID=29144 RepID=A0A6J2WG75_CHACN|nr:coiled-coil domain-containing protein 170 [Chanos chanos]